MDLTSATVEEAELVPSLWQQLPADLLGKVLSKLPLSVLRKFSMVSKGWKALFRSMEFAHECESVEWTFFYQAFSGEVPCLFLPNLKTNSWDKYSLDFIRADEYIDECHVAVDSGLLCYNISKRRGRGFDPSIILVVQNPLTRKWRRLIAPWQLEGDLNRHKRMWGLMVDRENESYKVIVAFYDQKLPRKAFIYDSVSKSWSISAAFTPVLVPHFNDYGWKVRSVVCSNGELLWLIEESEELVFKWLIKYNFELDAWSTVTQNSALLVEGEVYLVHHDVEKRPVIVNFRESRPGMPNFPFSVPGGPEVILPSSVRFASESQLFELVPSLGKICMEDIDRLVNEAGDTKWPANFEPTRVAFGGGTWYFLSDGPTWVLDVFAVSVNPPIVIRLPKIYDTVLRLGTFAATLKAFV